MLSKTHHSQVGYFYDLLLDLQAMIVDRFQVQALVPFNGFNGVIAAALALNLEGRWNARHASRTSSATNLKYAPWCGFVIAYRILNNNLLLSLSKLSFSPYPFSISQYHKSCRLFCYYIRIVFGVKRLLWRRGIVSSSPDGAIMITLLFNWTAVLLFQ